MSFLPVYRNRKIGPNTNGRNSLCFVDVDTTHKIPATLAILAQEDGEWYWHARRGWILSRLRAMFSSAYKLECNAYGMALTVAWEGWREADLIEKANILYHNYAKKRISEARCKQLIEQHKIEALHWCVLHEARLKATWESLKK